MTDEHQQDGPSIESKRLAAYSALPPSESRELRLRARKYIAATLRTTSVKADITRLFQDPRSVDVRRHEIVAVLLREDIKGDLAALPELVVGHVLLFVLRTQGILTTNELRFLELSGEQLAAHAAKKAEKDLAKAKSQQAYREKMAARGRASTDKPDKQT